MRRRRSPEQREAICKAHNWTCCICKGQIDPVREKWILEHEIPLASGGADDETNIAPAHQRCAIEKTKDDLTKIAKGKRIRANFLGTRIKAGKPIPGSRRSPWKKKMDGTVERR